MGLRLLMKEFQLLARSRVAWLVVAATIGLSALGVNAIENANQVSFRGMRRTAFTMSLGAAQYAALAGAALFALLTLLRMSRDDRKQSRTLLEASGDYDSIIVSRILATLLLATLTTVIALLGAVTLHVGLTDAPLEWSPYLFSFGVLLWPTLAFSTLAASSLYLLFRNLDVAFFGFAGLYWFGIKSSDYLMRWIQTPATAYSDFGGIDPVGRLMVYSRLFCGAAVLALVFLSMLLHRRPGFGLWQSLLTNSRRGLLPAAWVITTVLAVIVYDREPHISTGDSILAHDLVWNKDIKLGRLECQVQLSPGERGITGEVSYGFEKEKDAAELELITNTGLEIDSMRVNGEETSWAWIPGSDRVRVELPPSTSVELVCRYHGRIRSSSAGAFSGYIAPRSVYLLENSHWLPEPLTATKGRIAIQGTVTAPASLTVVTPGTLERVEEVNETRIWHFAALAPHIQIGLFAAEYEVERITVGDLDVEFYFSPRHREYIEEAGLTNHLAAIVGFFQETIGSPAFVDWPLKVVESSIYKPGGHSSLNVLTVAEYMWNREDPNSGRDQLLLEVHDLKLFAHEVAHQWWGTSVDVVPDGPWTSEGLAEYSAYRYARRHVSEMAGSSIRGGWYLAVKRQRDKYWVKDPTVLERMRPSERRRLKLKTEAREAYSLMPLRLAETEKALGEAEFDKRLASVHARYGGGKLRFDQFLEQMDLTREEFLGE